LTKLDAIFSIKVKYENFFRIIPATSAWTSTAVYVNLSSIDLKIMLQLCIVMYDGKNRT